MLLEDRIAAVAALGADIFAALAANDLPACEKLIDERGQLLAGLAAARDDASQLEVLRCQDAMEELLRQDAALQERFGAASQEINTARDSMLGRHGTSGHTSPYQPADATCLDRKA